MPVKEILIRYQVVLKSKKKTVIEGKISFDTTGKRTITIFKGVSLEPRPAVVAADRANKTNKLRDDLKSKGIIDAAETTLLQDYDGCESTNDACWLIRYKDTGSYTAWQYSDDNGVNWFGAKDAIKLGYNVKFSNSGPKSGAKSKKPSATPPVAPASSGSVSATAGTTASTTPIVAHSGESYTIEQLCAIFKGILEKANKGQKTAAQGLFYIVYRDFLKQFASGSAEMQQIQAVMGTGSGGFSWVTSFCAYLEQIGKNFDDVYAYAFAKTNTTFTKATTKAEKIEELIEGLETLLEDVSSVIGASVYFGFINAQKIKDEGIKSKDFSGITTDKNTTTIVNALWFGVRLYFFILDHEADLTRPSTTSISAVVEEEIVCAKPLTYEHNRIIFGAPGTGKSRKLKVESKALVESGEVAEIERVTFHPDYSYAHFVGTYKPIMEGEKIVYKFVKGPFLRVYEKARLHPENNYILIIEEINRANVAAVFGDVFQLLDRLNGVSEYPIAASEDIRRHFYEMQEQEPCEFPEVTFIQEEIDGEPRWLDIIENISIPANMYIWATMNSADQGVFPMDTAFKRRWSFEYTDLDQELAKSKQPKYWDAWEKFRKAVNDRLRNAGINEDKCMGPFFINPKWLDVWLSNSDFKEKFISKILMYLFEDAAKQKRGEVFAKDCTRSFSNLCKAFRNKPSSVFTEDIQGVLLEIEEMSVSLSAADGVDSLGASGVEDVAETAMEATAAEAEVEAPLSEEETADDAED